MTSQRHRLAAPPEALDDDPPIGLVMTPHVVAIAPDAPLRVGLRLMASNNLRHLPVIENSRCLGVVLETDIVRAVAIGEPSCSAHWYVPYRRCRSTSGDRRPPAPCWQGTSTQFSSPMGDGWSASSRQPTWHGPGRRRPSRTRRLLATCPLD